MARLKTLGARLGGLRPRLSSPKIIDRFYASPAYQAWANAVKARADWRCTISGCATPEDRLVAHHIRERKDGGADLDPANGVALCHAHHQRVTALNRAARAKGGGGV